MNTDTGILLTNVGTPDDLSLPAIRHYLKQFLSDRRVVELSPLLWQPILQGFILRTRPRQTLKLYQKIWEPHGSPLRFFSKNIAHLLEQKLQIPVEVGMHYSHPSIEQALTTLKNRNTKKIIVLPLYPQYSATTTAATFDKVAAVLKKWRDLPEIHLIKDYCTYPDYIHSIAAQIQNTWQATYRAPHLLFSFHSIPQKYANLGDPYPKLCLQTAQKIAEHLQLTAHEWSIGFQSRIGKEVWASPYTDHLLKQFPAKGITDLQVICPGFAVDCLETLEEIAIRGEEQFLKAGGEKFFYIPALNDSIIQINMVANLLNPYLK